MSAAPTYVLDGQEVDVFDLKVAIITRGINLPEEVSTRFGASHRLAPASNQRACNCVLLPGDIPAHVFHVGPTADFSLGIGDDDRPYLTYKSQLVTEVEFPPATDFYERKSASGMPYGMMAILEGLDVLSFPYLWPCQFALAEEPCQFCYQANRTVRQMLKGNTEFRLATPEDVAEVVDFCVRELDICDVRLTGGSEIDSANGEVPITARMVAAIAQTGSLAKLPGEILSFTSAPKDPAAIDEAFDAGIDRIAYDLNAWDQATFEEACPGIARYIGRPRQLAGLEYIAEKYGPNRACSVFVIGIEPLDTLLAGAEYLGSRGIVPLFSVWLPHGQPVCGKSEPPGLDYYRHARKAFLDIWDKYQLEPAGGAGTHVCMERDLWLHRDRLAF